MRSQLTCGLALLAIGTACAATDGPVTDTTRVYPLDEVVVTATRFETRLDQLSSPATRIPRARFEVLPGSMLADGLEGESGLAFHMYGAGGALQTLSLRGNSPEHTLVLIDGERYNSVQNGLVDFGMLASNDVEKVEIVRGGYSSLYGADALGGVVNIFTRRPSATPTASVQSTFGSNGLSILNLSGSGTVGDVGLRGTLMRERGRGDYEFRFDRGTGTSTFRRNDADYQSLSSSALMEYAPSEEIRARIDGSYTTADRGVPGQVFDPSTTAYARQSDVVGRIHASVLWKADQIWSVRLHSSYDYGDERYRDPGNSYVTPSVSLARSLSISPEAVFAYGPMLTGTAGAEYSRASVSSTDLIDHARVSRGIFLSTQHVFGLRDGIPGEIVLMPSLRYDAFSDVDGAVSPRLGTNIGVLPGGALRLRASYGASYRAPSFNDLYSVWGGNALLKPERSRSVDAGLSSAVIAEGHLRADLSYYTIRTKDRILWTPDLSGIWTPKNLRETSSEGVESEIAWSTGDGVLDVTVNGTYTLATKVTGDSLGDPGVGKILPFVSKYSLGVTVLAHLSPVDISLRHVWHDVRFADEANSRTLPAFGLLSAAVTYKYALGRVILMLKLEGMNLFNTDYVVMDGYPMPLREFRGTLGLAF